jgi:UDP-glucose 4-epimerase
MNIIVTGANGFVGLHTVKQLIKEGYNVTAVDMATNNIENIAGLKIVKVDLTKDDLSTLVTPGDKVIHLAAVAKFADAENDPVKAINVNVIGTQRLLQACQGKAERIVHASTGSVYSNNAINPINEETPRGAKNMYGISKTFGEDLVMFSKTPYIILRYGYIYGMNKNWGAAGAFVDKILKNERPVIFGGTQINDFTYVKDIVRANLLALNASAVNQVYNIGTGEGYSVLELYQWIKKFMKSSVEPIVEQMRGGIDSSVFVYNTTKAQKVLKFEADWLVPDGIHDMLIEMNLAK